MNRKWDSDLKYYRNIRISEPETRNRVSNTIGISICLNREKETGSQLLSEYPGVGTGNQNPDLKYYRNIRMSKSETRNRDSNIIGISVCLNRKPESWSQILSEYPYVWTGNQSQDLKYYRSKASGLRITRIITTLLSNSFWKYFYCRIEHGLEFRCDAF